MAPNVGTKDPNMGAKGPLNVGFKDPNLGAKRLKPIKKNPQAKHQAMLKPIISIFQAAVLLAKQLKLKHRPI
jgi:hypothetical protein